MKIPSIFILEKNLKNNVEKLLNKEPVKVPFEYTKFEVVYAEPYAKGIAKLKEQGRRPFTFSENVEARIADYEVNGENAELFKTYLDSVTGVAYKTNSTKFRIILRSDKLENIKPDFNHSFIPTDYRAEKGIELDIKKGKYNQPLTRKEARNHEFWIAAVGDKEKLAKYVDIWFDRTRKNKGMGVYLRSDTDKDELRELVFYYDEGNSNAFGDLNLFSSVRFLLGIQQK